MKALSVYQPFSSLIAACIKCFETRPRAWKYRGPLLICAAKRVLMWNERCFLAKKFPKYLWGYLIKKNSPFELYDKMAGDVPGFDGPGYDCLPFGKALCIVDFTDCLPTQRRISGSNVPTYPWAKRDMGEREIERELTLGDYSPGRFALKLENVRRFVEPWPVRGQQGLFDVPDEEVKKHEVEAVK